MFDFKDDKMTLVSMTTLSMWFHIYNHKCKKSIILVGIKARDQSDCLYQIEIQLCGHADLPERIFDTWRGLYSKQIQNSKECAKL